MFCGVGDGAILWLRCWSAMAAADKSMLPRGGVASRLGRLYAFAMARWDVGFDGRWRESFHDFGEAVEWARGVAETGRTVDVAKRRWPLRRKLVAVFPESERAQREAIWSASAMLGWASDGG